uniref:CSON014835 protein n=1 Tax=Culicoides sonorensis TaxID=179676 RepID=A0A336MPB9_CULSO
MIKEMILGIVLALLSVLHYYIIRDRKYFERINVKFVNPFPLLGTSWKAIFGYETYFDYYERIYKQFPTEKFFGAFDFLKPVYVIRDVELCRKVMITNFDHFVNRRLTIDVNTDPVAGRFIGFVKNESWRKLRAITSPAFTGNKMKFIVSLLNESMQKITKNLGVKIKLSEKKCFRYNGYDFYTRCCTNLIANTTFGLEVNAVDEENDEFYLMGKRLTDLRKDFFLRAILFQVSPTLAKVLNISLFDREATEYLKRIAKETIDYRTKNNVKVPNFIQLFMDADLSFEEIIPECIAFFFGGIDSFSTLFQFISYELALNPDVQKRLQSEIDQIQSQLGGSSIEYESVQKLTYMDAVINETFRKNPAGAFLERVSYLPKK